MRPNGGASRLRVKGLMALNIEQRWIGVPKATPPLTASAVPAMAADRGSYMRPQAAAETLFETGQRVRTRNINPAGHTRLPRYARGKEGIISRNHGIFVFPDTNAHFEGEQPQSTPHPIVESRTMEPTTTNTG